MPQINVLLGILASEVDVMTRFAQMWRAGHTVVAFGYVKTA
jgi:hypothetical protein